MEEIAFTPGRDICGKERKIKNGHNNSSGIIGEKSILD